MPTPREPRETRIVDMRIPLHWMLSTAGAILVTLAMTLWNIAGQSSKLDQLIIANAKMEKRLDDRDARIDVLRDRLSQVDRALDALGLRIEVLERAAHERGANNR